MNILTVLCLVLNFLAFLFMSLSCGGNVWLRGETSSSGIWKSCYTMNDVTTCEKLDIDKLSSLGNDFTFMKAVQAFTILAVLVAVAAFVACLLTMVTKFRGYFAAVPCFLSGLFQLIAMAVFTAKIEDFKGTSSFGWSFGIGWTSVFFPLVAGITMLVNSSANNQINSPA